MSMDHLRDVHYPQAHKDISKCSPLARKMFNLIRAEPMTTSELRKALPPTVTLTKSALDRALVELQVTLNITRSNAPEIQQDTWLRFFDQYPWLTDRTDSVMKAGE